MCIENFSHSKYSNVFLCSRKKYASAFRLRLSSGMTLFLRRLFCHCVTAKQAEILSPVPSWENQSSINTIDPNTSCLRCPLLHSTPISSLLSSVRPMLKDTRLTERSGLRTKWFQSHVPGTVQWSKSVCGVRISNTAEIVLSLATFFFCVHSQGLLYFLHYYSI